MLVFHPFRDRNPVDSVFQTVLAQSIFWTCYAHTDQLFRYVLAVTSATRRLPAFAFRWTQTIIFLKCYPIRSCFLATCFYAALFIAYLFCFSSWAYSWHNTGNRCLSVWFVRKYVPATHVPPDTATKHTWRCPLSPSSA